MTNTIAWEEQYSVGVELIDNQHKKLFEIINRLIEMLGSSPTQSQINEILSALVEYKEFHFKTEEDYFEKFNYPDTQRHITKHREFNLKLETITKEYAGDPISLAFNLAGFLEDWLIQHLMTEDQKYVTCFKEHGLK